MGGQPHVPATSTPGKDPVPTLQEAGWNPGLVWTGGKSRPHRDSIPDRRARSQSLYRLKNMINLSKTAKCVTRRSKFISNVSKVRDKLEVWIRLTIGRANAKREGTRAETRIGLSAKWTSPFQSAGGSVQSTTGSRGVRMKDARRLATHSIRIFPLHFPSRASPCAIRSRVSYKMCPGIAMRQRERERERDRDREREVKNLCATD